MFIKETMYYNFFLQTHKYSDNKILFKSKIDKVICSPIKNV